MLINWLVIGRILLHTPPSNWVFHFLVSDLLEVVTELLNNDSGFSGLDGVIVHTNDDSLGGLDGDEASLSELAVDRVVISSELNVLVALDHVASSSTGESLGDGSGLGISDGETRRAGPLAAWTPFEQ